MYDGSVRTRDDAKVADDEEGTDAPSPERTGPHRAVQQSALVLEPGSILAEKYRVIRVVGRGGMGVVVEARHVALGGRVAVKLLLPESMAHAEASERFLREARAAS